MSHGQPLDPKRERPATAPHLRGEATLTSQDPHGKFSRKARCWISIGSNQDRERCIRGAVHALRARFGRLILSSVYESEALGFDGQPFFNLVAGFDSGEPVSVLLASLRAIEDGFGRVRGPNKFAPRTLDLDLLTYGGLAGTIDGCTLPRDEILYHAFVLGPLAEVAAQERHPASGRCYGELWRAFEKSAQPLRPVAFEF
ncbi:2-amino-4-hydroxy-6-hydroxymethyldihydropteridine diphosphokinase [Candidatus Thiosymbion oneisti]|uniref:2-amino-4-hydroxy-6- hydroxymethyldihydropteridine diphosphokinase n=1 Tax=Candidatus Thiosymbion oneisti TaxID=589554 RepID=UPI000A53D242|nr:2-amino-4-hydroxy-6-hydroxymethyldihydropteridine diphosphokinase [Candidatus Thiosymbion oneisti]